ncbi:MAG: 4Fe-4S dicluster domain-containing protein [Acidobacteria bacterium]|nr:4Fe-4S dicluster domain-containing protein [Acidobacteriota bacterium]
MISRKAFLRVSGISLLAAAGRKVAAALGVASPATRWAMVVDPRKCAQAGDSCTKCVAACHAAHNVPSFEDRRHEVKWIWKEPFQHVFTAQQSRYTEAVFQNKPLMVLCNHCDSPSCVRVCPTQATWKREDGIVMMDWHRCIGCRYCVAACPYGSRSFNWLDPRPRVRNLNPDFPTRSKGVVEKCTFCEERLAKGRPPACVEACPHKALVFGNLSDPRSEVRTILGSRFTLRRKPELGTQPEVYYII